MRVAAQVAESSIRSRILKDLCKQSHPLGVVCCREFDPFEDTERSQAARLILSPSRCCREFDPFEDTESVGYSTLNNIRIRSCREFDPFEDTESDSMALA